jgi:hypothetical protein
VNHNGAIALCFHEAKVKPGMRIILLLLCAALCGCATTVPQSPDARALCEQQAQASSSSPDASSKAYFDECMSASRQRAK